MHLKMWTDSNSLEWAKFEKIILCWVISQKWGIYATYSMLKSSENHESSGRNTIKVLGQELLNQSVFFHI